MIQAHLGTTDGELASALCHRRTKTMKNSIAPVVFACLSISVAAGQTSPTTASGPSLDETVLAKAGNGESIFHPASKKSYSVKDGDRTIQVPIMMVYIPTGAFKVGSGNGTTAAEGYCIGKFSVTNAEYKEFLNTTGSRNYPRHWSHGTYPDGKANNPVVYVSLTEAKAYAQWVSEKTGWNVVIPTSNHWEKAARGPKGFLYPWGDSLGTSYRDGVLTSRFSYNGITAAQFLKDSPKRVVKYNNERSPYFGKTTTIDQIAGYDRDGHPTYLSVEPNGSVRGWVNHETYTGFIYTDLFTSLNEQGGNTAPVGSYEAGKSAYGCYDMAGNVWNWCDTLIVATNGAEKGKRVNEIRGGSWYANPTSCKSISIGEGRSATGAYNTVGFRIAMIPRAK
jgi:formylglycine-generating enzyme required for sulfatase activity